MVVASICSEQQLPVVALEAAPLLVHYHPFTPAPQPDPGPLPALPPPASPEERRQREQEAVSKKGDGLPSQWPVVHLCNARLPACV